MIIQLFKDGKEIIASDGIMYVDGRLSVYNIGQQVKERNRMKEKNFPQKVCDSWQKTGERLRLVGQRYSL